MLVEIRALDRLPAGTTAAVEDVLEGNTAGEYGLRAAAALIGRAVMRVREPIGTPQIRTGDTVTLEDALEYVTKGEASERTARRARAEIRKAVEALRIIAAAPLGDHDSALVAAQILASSTYAATDSRETASRRVGSAWETTDARRIRAVIARGSRAAYQVEAERQATRSDYWGMHRIVSEIEALERIGYGATDWRGLADRRVLGALASHTPSTRQGRLNSAVDLWLSIQRRDPLHGGLTQKAAQELHTVQRNAADIFPWAPWGALVRECVHDVLPVSVARARIAASTLRPEGIRWQITTLATYLSAEPRDNPGGELARLEAAISESKGLGSGARRGCLARWVESARVWHGNASILADETQARARTLEWDMYAATGAAARAFDDRLVECARALAEEALMLEGSDGSARLTVARMLARAADSHETRSWSTCVAPSPEDPAGIQSWLEHIAPIAGAVDAALDTLPDLLPVFGLLI